MKKIVFFAVFGVLFAPLSFAQEQEDQTLEFNPSAWRKPVSRMMPLKPDMPEITDVEAYEGESSFSETELESLKRQLEEIEQRLQALLTEKEVIMQKMKIVRPVWREEQKEMKKEIREENREMKEGEEGMMLPENKPMEMQAPRAGFTPFQYKKDARKALSITSKFKVDPKMLQQSLIRPPLSEDQKEARSRQADAKKKLMKFLKVSQ